MALLGVLNCMFSSPHREVGTKYQHNRPADKFIDIFSCLHHDLFIQPFRPI